MASLLRSVFVESSLQGKMFNLLSVHENNIIKSPCLNGNLLCSTALKSLTLLLSISQHLNCPIYSLPFTSPEALRQVTKHLV